MSTTLVVFLRKIASKIGHKAKKVRVTGYLLWDDDHNESADVGSTIALKLLRPLRRRRSTPRGRSYSWGRCCSRSWCHSRGRCCSCCCCRRGRCRWCCGRRRCSRCGRCCSGRRCSSSRCCCNGRRCRRYCCCWRRCRGWRRRSFWHPESIDLVVSGNV